MFGNLVKAGVAVVVSPVALVVDVVTLPATAFEVGRPAFWRTEKLLSVAGENIIKAVE